MLKHLLFLLLTLTLGVPPTHAQTLRAGASRRVITPDPLLPVSGGIGTPKKTVEKKGDLYVRAMVLEKGDTRVAFVSIDNLGWPSVLVISRGRW